MVSIKTIPVRAKVVIGVEDKKPLTIETPYVRSFSGTKARGQVVSTFNVELEIEESALDNLGDPPMDVKIYAGEKGSLRQIFKGHVVRSTATQHWERAGWWILRLTCNDVLDKLKNKKFSRRLRTGQDGIFVGITGAVGDRPRLGSPENIPLSGKKKEQGKVLGLSKELSVLERLVKTPDHVQAQSEPTQYITPMPEVERGTPSTEPLIPPQITIIPNALNQVTGLPYVMDPMRRTITAPPEVNLKNGAVTLWITGDDSQGLNIVDPTNTNNLVRLYHFDRVTTSQTVHFEIELNAELRSGTVYLLHVVEGTPKIFRCDVTVADAVHALGYYGDLTPVEG